MKIIYPAPVEEASALLSGPSLGAAGELKLNSNYILVDISYTNLLSPRCDTMLYFFLSCSEYKVFRKLMTNVSKRSEADRCCKPQFMALYAFSDGDMRCCSTQSKTE